MAKQKDRLVNFNIKIAEDVKREIYGIANRRTIAGGKTVSIAQVGRELLDDGLAQHRNKS